ncbi:MAG: hypothetical protein QOJ79_2811 [Actinomycetota bacterium]|nr:hypothetical protein [Actinomycetota bacterium]
MIFPAPTFNHLRDLTDAGGLYEHADRTTVRREHGYCVDDVARALVVVCRSDDRHDDLRRQYLEFVLAAQSTDGRFRNRRDIDLAWSDEPSVDDCWGRALWGLGTAASAPGCDDLRPAALAAFERGATHRSPWSRAMAFAGLGAAEVLRTQPGHLGARALLADAARHVGRPSYDEVWPWPEPRLTYANAALPEVLMAAGAALDLPLVTVDGLMLLGWLLDVQTRDGHLSVVPVGGRGPMDAIGGFDQQPIEVAAVADACARAFALTDDPRWRDGVERAAAWFLGSNDANTSLLDPATGGGCDGLERHGRNENQGAESTLALLSTLQHARALALVDA